MKSKEFAELKMKSIAELNTDLDNKKGELFNLRFQLATGQLQNTATISACKRDIARILTVISQLQNEKQA